jgi:hypothetical protein
MHAVLLELLAIVSDVVIRVPDAPLEALELERAQLVLARALEPFPAPVRTLAALHLASIEFLRGRGQAIELARYDERLVAAARGLGVPITSL